jgi:PTS system beta-glucosides-specific IIC component
MQSAWCKVYRVIAVVESGGQFQVVIGTHVADVFNAMSGLVKETGSAPAAQKKRVVGCGDCHHVGRLCTDCLHSGGGRDSAGMLIVLSLIDADIKLPALSPC